MWNYTFLGADVYHIMVWFLFYSILGWGAESVYMSFCNRKLTNRGFARMPMCPIYGVGAVVVYFLLKPFSHHMVILYVMGVIIPTILEYITAQIMLKIFGEVWWDYHDKPFNYKGILCLESSLAWGVYTLLMFTYLQNAANRMTERIPDSRGQLLGVLILLGYMLDFSICFYREKSPDVTLRERIRTANENRAEIQDQIQKKLQNTKKKLFNH